MNSYYGVPGFSKVLHWRQDPKNKTVPIILSVHMIWDFVESFARASRVLWNPASSNKLGCQWGSKPVALRRTGERHLVMVTFCQRRRDKWRWRVASPSLSKKAPRQISWSGNTWKFQCRREGVLRFNRHPTLILNHPHLVVLTLTRGMVQLMKQTHWVQRISTQEANRWQIHACVPLASLENYVLVSLDSRFFTIVKLWRYSTTWRGPLKSQEAWEIFKMSIHSNSFKSNAQNKETFSEGTTQTFLRVNTYLLEVVMHLFKASLSQGLYCALKVSSGFQTLHQHQTRQKIPTQALFANLLAVVVHSHSNTTGKAWKNSVELGQQNGLAPAHNTSLTFSHG